MAKQPPLAIRWLECNPKCDVCGVHRSSGDHKKCSKVRKAKYQENKHE